MFADIGERAVFLTGDEQQRNPELREQMPVGRLRPGSHTPQGVGHRGRVVGHSLCPRLCHVVFAQCFLRQEERLTHPLVGKPLDAPGLDLVRQSLV